MESQLAWSVPGCWCVKVLCSRVDASTSGFPLVFQPQEKPPHTSYPAGVFSQSFTLSDTDASAASGVFHAVFGDHGSYSTLSLSELRRPMQKAALTCVKKSHVSFLGQT